MADPRSPVDAQRAADAAVLTALEAMAKARLACRGAGVDRDNAIRDAIRRRWGVEAPNHQALFWRTRDLFAAIEHTQRRSPCSKSSSSSPSAPAP